MKPKFTMIKYGSNNQSFQAVKMCRLLGVIANKSVDLEFSLERFRSLATRNPDYYII